MSFILLMHSPKLGSRVELYLWLFIVNQSEANFMASDWIKFRFHSLVQIVLNSISLALYLPLFSSTLDTYHLLLYSIQGSSICWTDNGIHSFNMAGLGFGRIYSTYTIPGINRHISDLVDDTTSAVIFFIYFYKSFLLCLAL